MKEADQHHSEAWFQAIVGGTADAYIGVNLPGQVVVFNPAAEALFGRRLRSFWDAGSKIAGCLTDCGGPSAMPFAKLPPARR